MVTQSRTLYQRLQSLSEKRSAVRSMGLVSFAESFIFPFPPDLILIPLILGKPERSWNFALICTITSVVGGIIGYIIGYFLYSSLGAWIISTYGLEASFHSFQDQFQKWGFWIIALKGLTPLPYKFLTISSGLAKFDFLTFLVASVIARGSRFFILTSLLVYFGPTCHRMIEKYSWWFFAITIGIIVVGFVGVKLLLT